MNRWFTTNTAKNLVMPLTRNGIWAQKYSINTLKSRQTRYINQIPSETQRFGCETPVTLTA